ncbi:MAG: RluA family pseudouridine synthase [Pseudomonadota bacterium]
MQNPISLCVEADDVGLRLDRFLNAHFPNESRSRVQQWLEQGCLARGDTPFCQASYKIKANEVFLLTPPELEETHIIAEDIPIDIIYEDDDILVLNKPVGLVVHPAPGHRDGTLVNALLAHCGDSLSGIGGVKRPGIVHRLDKDTSGLMVIAKNDYAHNALSAQFHPDAQTLEKTLVRRYKALVFGKLTRKTLTLEGEIGRHSSNRQKMTLLKYGGGKKAITHLTLDESWVLDGVSTPISLLDCQLGTGRTHQIRVHCQSINCHIIGDPLYGKSQYQRLKNMPEVIQNFSTQALHAYRLSFVHPTTGDLCDFTSDLPTDMAAVLAVLGESN